MLWAIQRTVCTDSTMARYLRQDFPTLRNNPGGCTQYIDDPSTGTQSILPYVKLLEKRRVNEDSLKSCSMDRCSWVQSISQPSGWWLAVVRSPGTGPGHGAMPSPEEIARSHYPSAIYDTVLRGRQILEHGHCASARLIRFNICHVLKAHFVEKQSR